MGTLTEEQKKPKKKMHPVGRIVLAIFVFIAALYMGNKYVLAQPSQEPAKESISVRTVNHDTGAPHKTYDVKYSGDGYNFEWFGYEVGKTSGTYVRVTASYNTGTQEWDHQVYYKPTGSGRTAAVSGGAGGTFQDKVGNYTLDAIWTIKAVGYGHSGTQDGQQDKDGNGIDDGLEDKDGNGIADGQEDKNNNGVPDGEEINGPMGGDGSDAGGDDGGFDTSDLAKEATLKEVRDLLKDDMNSQSWLKSIEERMWSSGPSTGAAINPNEEFTVSYWAAAAAKALRSDDGRLTAYDRLEDIQSVLDGTTDDPFVHNPDNLQSFIREMKLYIAADQSLQDQQLQTQQEILDKLVQLLGKMDQQATINAANLPTADVTNNPNLSKSPVNTSVAGNKLAKGGLATKGLQARQDDSGGANSPFGWEYIQKFTDHKSRVDFEDNRNLLTINIPFSKMGFPADKNITIPNLLADYRDDIQYYFNLLATMTGFGIFWRELVKR